DAVAVGSLLPAAHSAGPVPIAAVAPAGVEITHPTPAVPAVPAAAPAITVEMLAAPDLVLKPAATSDRTVGMVVQGKPVQFAWKGGAAPPIQAVADQYYGARMRASSLVDLVPVVGATSDVALNLPHIYYYVVPLGLAECYHALGDYAAAQAAYLQAAGYQ